jgi:cytochrome c
MPAYREEGTMDTMTITKAGGAFCGSLLIFLLGLWVAEEIYHVGGGYGEERAMGYAIEVAEAETDSAEEVAEVPFEEVYANASAADGERLWRQCASCHNLEGGNATGPYLNGVVDRPIGAVEGYAYSDALASHPDGAWTPANLSAFLLAPRDYAEGTKMAYRGMSDVQDRANLIAYLAQTQ